MARGKIFVSWPGYSADDPETGKRIVDAGFEPLLHPRLGDRTEDELIAMLDGAVAAIASADPFTARVIAASPGLRVIARVGVGTDSIDLEAANRHGVAVSITVGQNAETVADATLALILALVRKVIAQHESVMAGRWERVGPLRPSELPGKTVGLVGAGTIGRAVARRLAGFGVSIVFFDRYVDGLDGARKVESLDELLAVSDVVSLHTPLTPETRHMIDAAALAKMKPTAFLINTARGSLVDQAALFAALKEGRLAGAGLDVFEDEPPKPGAFDGIPNLIVSAHIAGVSNESARRMSMSATESALAMLAGEIPDTVLNPDVLHKQPIVV